MRTVAPIGFDDIEKAVIAGQNISLTIEDIQGLMWAMPYTCSLDVNALNSIYGKPCIYTNYGYYVVYSECVYCGQSDGMTDKRSCCGHCGGPIQ